MIVTTICQSTSNILLYVSDHLTHNENQQIFLAVKDFLINLNVSELLDV